MSFVKISSGVHNYDDTWNRHSHTMEYVHQCQRCEYIVRIWISLNLFLLWVLQGQPFFHSCLVVMERQGVCTCCANLAFEWMPLPWHLIWPTCMEGFKCFILSTDNSGQQKKVLKNFLNSVSFIKLVNSHWKWNEKKKKNTTPEIVISARFQDI